ncbi:hypothetical protein P167DRAFT_361171 [Morchella conica CCBAS932]|uniref:Uncharacterized protein n=1 Tax=Morchella conica CCBAS932 TaxID=1392247 RepID=A0A3N4KCN9_9PEZI|nr:hypothetical protein P167DRAFT_361171 [Morchella conica CCBAS932]
MYDLFCAPVFFHQLITIHEAVRELCRCGFGIHFNGIHENWELHACNTGKMGGIAATITTCRCGDGIHTYVV